MFTFTESGTVLEEEGARRVDMRYLPGWAVGALGTGALVGAFFLGSHLAAADLTPTAPAAADVTMLTATSRVAAPVSYRPAATYRPVAAARSTSVREASVSRAPVRRSRSVKKSVAIIAGSAAAGAVIGGLTKGKKGAVIGGLIGGGAATVWDQITRHRAR